MENREYFNHTGTHVMCFYKLHDNYLRNYTERVPKLVYVESLNNIIPTYLLPIFICTMLCYILSLNPDRLNL